MKILFIHCRRGLYQLTKCKACGHTFECKNCDAKLVTYRQFDRTLELVCHQCQTYYKYPNQCPECKSTELYSRFGGIEELVEILQRETELTTVRLDKTEKVAIGKESDIKIKTKPSVYFSETDVTNSPLESQVQSGLAPDDQWGTTGCQTQSDGVDNKFDYLKLPRNKALIERAKELRQVGNLSEVLFWQAFNQKKIFQWDLDRQAIIGNYIVDFFIPELGLVFEIDGESHDLKGKYDEVREKYLLELGLEIVRFNDKDIKKKINSVEEMVVSAINQRVNYLKSTPSRFAIHPSRGELKNICISDRQDKGALVNGNLIDDIEKTDQIFVHTRIFDPAIPYSAFDQIIFVQAENLLASADYLVAEEMMKSLAEVLLQVNEKTKLIFDTNSVELEMFQELAKLHFENSENISVYRWYLDFLEKEKLNRGKFGFPPFKNLLLLTTQEKSSINSLDKLKIVNDYLVSLKADLPEVSWSSPYPAKFLKRRNMYSHHILIRYPRQYEYFNLLRKQITQLGDLYNLQLRLNPRHLF
jgi:very-short-patch-repair endonuclease